MLARLRLSPQPRNLGERHPRLREPALVAELHQPIDRRADRVGGLVERDVRVDLEPHLPADGHGASLCGRVAAAGRRLDRLAQRRLGEIELAGVPKRLAELCQQLRPGGMVGIEEAGRTRQERDRGGNVSKRVRTPARCGETIGALLGQETLGLASAAELAPVAIRLLQVVAGDLVELRSGIAARRDEPLRELNVQRGAAAFRQRLVRRLADERVREPVRVRVQGPVLERTDEPTARKLLERPCGSLLQLLGQHRRERSEGELGAQN